MSLFLFNFVVGDIRRNDVGFEGGKVKILESKIWTQCMLVIPFYPAEEHDQFDKF